jgi:hypothetical protein
MGTNRIEDRMSRQTIMTKDSGRIMRGFPKIWYGLSQVKRYMGKSHCLK